MFLRFLFVNRILRFASKTYGAKFLLLYCTLSVLSVVFEHLELTSPDHGIPRQVMLIVTQPKAPPVDKLAYVELRGVR